MKKGLLALWLGLLPLLLCNSAWALSSNLAVSALNQQVLRVLVKHSNGLDGYGSAVVVEKNRLVTNCHVVENANTISVVWHGLSYPASLAQADWHHDLCLLSTMGLDAPIAKIGASKKLNYQDALVTVAFPGKVSEAVNTYGAVTGLYPMDGSLVIQASNPFKPGASGGGIFDTTGSLVGIITLKTKGDQAHYFYMPVEWVQALLTQINEFNVGTYAMPFWAASPSDRPYFMQVVQPYTRHDWSALLVLAQAWVSGEPTAAEAWFHLAVAEYESAAYEKASEHLMRALTLNHNHASAKDYLQKLQQKLAYTKLALNP